MKIKLMNKIAQIGLNQFNNLKYEVSEDFDEYDAMMVRSSKLHDINFSKKLKCIARAGAGVNNIPVDKCSEEGIVVFNTPGANANAVKELVICALILSGRKIIQGYNWVKTIEEDDMSKVIEQGKSNFVGPEIAGKKLGVIGLGAIGVQVANAAAAQGMDVYGYDPYISVQAAWTLKARINHTQELKTIFEECDYISVHVPFMEGTKNIIGSESFKLMKKGVRILNFARQGLVDEEAMIPYLTNEKISCYLTDFPSKKLIEFHNVIGLPHLGASTPESEDNCAVMAAQAIIEFMENGNIINSVNMPDMQLTQESKYRLCIINKNVPNMVGEMTSKLAHVGINIENMANRARKDYAYTILDTNDEVNDDLILKLQEQEGIKSVRLIVKT